MELSLLTIKSVFFFFNFLFRDALQFEMCSVNPDSFQNFGVCFYMVDTTFVWRLVQRKFLGFSVNASLVADHPFDRAVCLHNIVSISLILGFNSTTITSVKFHLLVSILNQSES